MKQAELSMQVLVIAIISLLVLVIIIFLFSGRLFGVNEGLGDCNAKGGTCRGSCNPDEFSAGFSDCEDSQPMCCLTIKS